MDMINLDSPARFMIKNILSCNPAVISVFGRTEKEDLFFKDLLTVGCDFYDLLDLFTDNNINDKNSIACIIDITSPEIEVGNLSDTWLRRMVPHWSSSKFHTAPVSDVCTEIRRHIINGSSGVYIYNSNLNSKNKKVYNDKYILIISNSDRYFFDINRKKTFHIFN